jgi:Domain of unknown function (DUF1508)
MTAATRRPGKRPNGEIIASSQGYTSRAAGKANSNNWRRGSLSFDHDQAHEGRSRAGRRSCRAGHAGSCCGAKYHRIAKLSTQFSVE